MHPKGKKYRRSDFGGAKNVLISSEIDTLPLLPLLQRVDFTLSEGSTIAVEGHTLGVPALIASQTGRLNYVREIEEGRFFYIENATDFDTIMMSVERYKDSFAKAPDIDVRAVLADLRRRHASSQMEVVSKMDTP
jgi:predicted glycosyltransferase